MILKDLSLDDNIYCYENNELKTIMKFKEWIDFDEKRALNKAVLVDKENKTLIFIIKNINQSICSIGNKKISTREL